MYLNLKAGLTLGLLTLAMTCHAQVGADTSNLLSNPGAETGDLTGWTVGGYGNPGIDTGLFDSGINPLTGNYDFCGFSGASDNLTQKVLLVGTQGITAAQIDTGSLFANLSFAEQGLNQGTPSDDAQISLTFFDTGGANLGTFTTPEVDSHEDAWQTFETSTPIPANTRSIDYSMLFVRNDGSDLDAFVDDNSLTVSGSGSPVPEASTTVSFGLMLALGGLTIIARKKSFHKVKAENAA